MEDWSDANDFALLVSASKLRLTLTSTILPDVMSSGRRIDGNSIYAR